MKKQVLLMLLALQGHPLAANEAITAINKTQTDCKDHADVRRCEVTEMFVENDSIVAAEGGWIVVDVRKRITEESIGLLNGGELPEPSGKYSVFFTDYLRRFEFDCGNYLGRFIKHETYLNGQLTERNLYAGDAPMKEIYQSGVMTSRKSINFRSQEWKVESGEEFKIFQIVCSSEAGKVAREKSNNETIGNSVPVSQRGGVYEAAVKINNFLELNFVVDSGAAYVTIPLDVFQVMKRTGKVAASDIKGKKRLITANGAVVDAVEFNIRSLKLGAKEVKNVSAVAISGDASDPLLGQSFLRQIEPWRIDTRGRKLVFK